MATQMTAAGVGVGVEKVAKEESRMAEAKKQSAAAAAAAKSRDESTGARVTSSNESSSVSRLVIFSTFLASMSVDTDEISRVPFEKFPC